MPMATATEKLDRFRTWFTDNGGFIHEAAKFSFNDEKGVHLIAEAQLTPGTAIITCSHSFTISAFNSTGRLSTFPSRLPKNVTSLPSELFAAVPRAQSLAAAWLCLHRALGTESFWAPYIDVLPSIASEPPSNNSGLGSIDTPLTWPPSSRSLIAGSPLEKGAADLEAIWRADWDGWGSCVAAWADTQGIGFEWEDYLWALTMLGSRSFSSAILQHVTHDGKPLTAQFDPDALLYPGIDMLNHSPHTLNRWMYDAQGFTLVCNDTVEAGGEVFNTYGAKNNGQLMLSYGFALQDNPHDAFPLKHAQAPGEPLPAQQTQTQSHPSTATGVTTDKPSVQPESCGTDNATFYFRPASSSITLPGYMPAGPFRGIPVELLNRLMRAQATSSESVAQSYPQRPLASSLSARAFLDLLSLLSLRTDADLLRLQPAIASIPSNTDTDPVNVARRQAAWTYMTGLFAILNEHRDRLQNAISASLSQFPQIFGRLTTALEEVYVTDAVLFASFARGNGGAFDDAMPTHEALAAIQALAAAWQDQGAEDVWVIYLGLVRAQPRLSPATSAWLTSCAAPPADGLERDEVDGLVAHAAEYIEACRGRDNDGGEAWAAAFWDADTLRSACWLVRDRSVAVQDPERPGKREVVLVREGQARASDAVERLLAL